MPMNSSVIVTSSSLTNLEKCAPSRPRTWYSCCRKAMAVMALIWSSLITRKSASCASLPSGCMCGAETRPVRCTQPAFHAPTPRSRRHSASARTLYAATAPFIGELHPGAAAAAASGAPPVGKCSHQAPQPPSAPGLRRHMCQACGTCFTDVVLPCCHQKHLLHQRCLRPQRVFPGEYLARHVVRGALHPAQIGDEQHHYAARRGIACCPQRSEKHIAQLPPVASAQLLKLSKPQGCTKSVVQQHPTVNYEVTCHPGLEKYLELEDGVVAPEASRCVGGVVSLASLFEVVVGAVVVRDEVDVAVVFVAGVAVSVSLVELEVAAAELAVVAAACWSDGGEIALVGAPPTPEVAYAAGTGCVCSRGGGHRSGGMWCACRSRGTRRSWRWSLSSNAVRRGRYGATLSLLRLGLRHGADVGVELGELTLMYSRSSDGEKPTPRIVQVIDYGESASQPLLHADDHVSVWNPLGHNGHGSEYGVSAWRLAPLRLPARTRVIALVPANGPDGGGPLMAVMAILATWCDAQLHLPESRTGAFRIQVRPIFNGQPSAHVVSVKWTHVRLIDMAVTTYCSLPPMETSRPAYAVNPRDMRSWAQSLMYFCTDDSMHSKRSSNTSKLACNGGSADLCSDGTALVAGLPFGRHGVRVTTVRDSSSTSSAVTHAGAQGRKGVLTEFNGTSVSTDPRTASCSPSSSSCHSTTRLSGNGSAFVPHNSAGTGTGDGDSTVLNGGDGVAEQCSTSCNNIREASVLGSDGSACVRHESAGTGDGVPMVLNCVRHESAGTGDGDSTVLNGGDDVAEQCSTSCNNICEASVLSSDGSKSVPRSLEGGDVDLAPAPCDVMPAATTHSVCSEDICAALAARADICSVLSNPTGDSGAGTVTRPSVHCNGVGGSSAGVSIDMASPVETTASDPNSSRPDEEDSPPVLNSSSETHAAPTALSMVNPHASASMLMLGRRRLQLEAVTTLQLANTALAPHSLLQRTHRQLRRRQQHQRLGSSLQRLRLPRSVAVVTTHTVVLVRVYVLQLVRVQQVPAIIQPARRSVLCASRWHGSNRMLLSCANTWRDWRAGGRSPLFLQMRMRRPAAVGSSQQPFTLRFERLWSFVSSCWQVPQVQRQLNSALADGFSGVTTLACSSSDSNSTVCGEAKCTINSEHCNIGARTAVGDSGHAIRGSCTGGKSVIKASVATSVRRKAAAPHRRTAAGASVNMAQQTLTGQASSRKPAAAAGSMHADDMLPAAVTPPLTAKPTGAITHNATASARRGTSRGTAVWQPHSQPRSRRTAQQVARSQRKHGLVSAPHATRSAPVSVALAPVTAEPGA
ncbi:hypothetical protein JKP88DRAFT_254252 [Tribonema minus]|uniref:C2H2-type domain-containing protein n=1 Tax=Tribonema minus TaxID=303371 RepID=A0A836CJ05_9STRA|nr:hypothetical protein JKP88DRAFT_254252 [Tribonema minus]